MPSEGRDGGGERIRVAILTYCRNADLFYGTSLVFRTLRVGFPTARITVTDNASLPEVRGEIRALAHSCDCRFEQIEGPDIPHDLFVERTIRAAAEGEHPNDPLVFVDPDVCFWQSCEGFRFDGLIAGPWLPAFRCRTTRSTTMPRIHTCFLWIRDPGALWAEIESVRQRHFDYDPFRSFSTRIAGEWYRFDTGANLVNVLDDRVSRFREAHLDCFDHLYLGSHLPLALPDLDPAALRIFQQIHDDARTGNLDALRGIRKRQNAPFFNGQQATSTAT